MLGRGRHCRQSLSLHQPKDTDSAAPLIRFGFANTMGDQKRSYRSRGCFCRKLGMCGSLHRASFARAFFGLLRRAEDSSVFMCLTDFDQKSVTYPIVDQASGCLSAFPESLHHPIPQPTSARLWVRTERNSRVASSSDNLLGLPSLLRSRSQREPLFALQDEDSVDPAQG